MVTVEVDGVRVECIDAKDAAKCVREASRKAKKAHAEAAPASWRATRQPPPTVSAATMYHAQNAATSNARTAPSAP